MDMAVQTIVIVMLPWLAMYDRPAATPLITAITADSLTLN